ncbi:MAG: amidohydrolase [Fusobacteriaceae bacterium]|jgi:predicted amidohydrolase YtcJ|nr:amidohydrolase [Fusobacteriaceae bacterium]
MKTILKNGKIYVERDYFVSALCIENGIITNIGGNEDISRWGNGKLIDLKGKTIVPGFNDSHMHLLHCYYFLQRANLLGSTSISSVIDTCKEFLATHPDKKILLGRGWNQGYFTDEKRLLNRWDLDKISTDIPVLLTRVCGHAAAVNSKVIELLKLDKNFSLDAGGRLGFDGEVCNGILYESAVNQIKYLINEPTKKTDVFDSLKKITYLVNTQGITSVSTNDIYIGYPDGKPVEDGYRLYEKDNPTVRINHQISFYNLETFKKRIEKGYNKTDNPQYNRYGPIKLFIDGSLGPRTALLTHPYADDSGTMGMGVLTQEEIDAFVQIATEHGIQCVTHGIGDGGIDRVLNAYESVIRGTDNPLRHGIIHAQVTRPDQLQRMAANHVPTLMQPIYLNNGISDLRLKVGEELASTSAAYKSMINMGIPVSYGTDSPIASYAVIPTIHCAVNRQNFQHYPKEGFYPSERVSVQEAIDAYTIEGARISFEENIKGRLLPGYYADMVVLSDDIFIIDKNHILDIQVEMTIMDGKIVYTRS